MKDYFQRVLVHIVSSLTQFALKFHKPPRLISGKDYRSYGESLPLAGSVLVSLTDGEWANYLIPDYWSHNAIYTGEGTVIEATAMGGVIETDLIDFMMRKDYIVAMEPKFASAEQMKKAVAHARTQVGKKYDFEFNYSDVESFYCSELIYWSYLQVIPNSPFTLRCVLGVMSVIPSDFVNAKDHWKLTWKSLSVK